MNPFANPNHPLDYDLLARDVVIPKQKSINKPTIEGFLIDPDSVYDSRRSTPRREIQDDWIKYFNRRGQIMIGPESIVHADKEVISSLQKDFKENWLTTGCRIVYDGMKGTIFHNYSAISPNAQKMMPTITIPECADALPALLKTHDGLQFMRYLMLCPHGDDRDAKYWITNNLSYVCGKKPKDILIGTPTLDYRKKTPHRVVQFSSSDNKVIISCGNGNNDSAGRSRGVDVVR